MGARLNKERVVPILLFLVFVGAFVSLVGYSLYDTFKEDTYDIGFDHYKTDISIEVSTDGKITQTERYWFEWKGIESGEMYLSKSASMSGNINVISVTIDGQAMSKASTYEQGRSMTNMYPDGSHGRWYYAGLNNFSPDYEINAFYPREYSGGYLIEFKYEVTGAVTEYRDCVDLYYKVFTYFGEDLKDLTVSVQMPAGTLQDKTRIFLHGDPNGYCEFIGDTANVAFKSTKLQAYTMFEIRVVNEQASLFNMPVKTGKTFASILAEEQKYYEDTQRAIFLSRFQPVILILIVPIPIIYVIFGKKLVKRNKPRFNQPYMREVPALKPNIAATLSRYYSTTGAPIGNKVTATILNLALRKIIAIEEGLKKDMVFVSLNRGAEMTQFERNVHEMIFAGTNGNRVTLEQVKESMSREAASGGGTILRIIDSDKREFNGHRFTDDELGDNNRKWKFVLIPVVAALALANFVISAFTEMFDYAGASMMAAFVAIVVLANYKTKTPLTVNGEDEHAKIQALKRFYTDMTLIKERRALELSFWEQHLVYATALGVADKVVKELDVRLRQISEAGTYPPSLIYLGTFSHIGSISDSFSKINSVPLSAYSSNAGGGGGGHGGGSTGGGGGGFGGGGGGHR